MAPPATPGTSGATATFSGETAGEPLGAERVADSTSPAAETPGELLSRANGARRSGQQERAVALYVELQRSFPGSAEANTSLVSLGRLMLARGQAEQALTQFSHYLEVGGSLQEEALLGKAQALARLQRRSEERVVWQVLLSRYPQSVYAVEAKEHLGEP